MKKLISLACLFALLSPTCFAQINCPQNLPLTLLGNTSYCVGTPGAELSVQENYDLYEWLPTSETSQNVLLTAGNYQLVVTHYTGCTDTINIEVEQVSNPPQPSVTANGPTEFCEGGSVTLSGPEGYPYYSWNTGSITQDITVYESITAVLSIVDWLGCTSSSNSIDVIVNPLPTAIFSPDLDGFDIEFNNVSLDATDYEWNFGDGSISTEFEPTHNYSIEGSVEMYLVAMNNCGSDTAFLNLTSVFVDEINPIDAFTVYPNPSFGEFNIQFSGISREKMVIEVYDLHGRLVADFANSIVVGQNIIQCDFSYLPSGTYVLRLRNQTSTLVTQLRLIN